MTVAFLYEGKLWCTMKNVFVLVPPKNKGSPLVSGYQTDMMSFYDYLPRPQKCFELPTRTEPNPNPMQMANPYITGTLKAQPI